MIYRTRFSIFLAVVEGKTRSNGYSIYTLGRELARDLLTIPAMSQNHSVLFPEIFVAVKDTYIYHELGEIQDTTFDRESWREMVVAFPFSLVEFIARALKDLLVDTNEYGTLHHIIQKRQTAGLAFYVAFIDGLAKEFFPEISIAFQKFAKPKNWRIIEQAVEDGYQTAKKHTMLILDIYRDGVKKDNLEWAKQRSKNVYSENT
ncbi:MAG: hypothetical protein HQ580_15260 [Planctomycetes bacterium]|nr:hypothetical protein [Planctomycetota bacterium]